MSKDPENPSVYYIHRRSKNRPKSEIVVPGAIFAGISGLFFMGQNANETIAASASTITQFTYEIRNFLEVAFRGQLGLAAGLFGLTGWTYYFNSEQIPNRWRDDPTAPKLIPGAPNYRVYIAEELNKISKN